MVNRKRMKLLIIALTLLFSSIASGMDALYESTKERCELSSKCTTEKIQQLQHNIEEDIKPDTDADSSFLLIHELFNYALQNGDLNLVDQTLRYFKTYYADKQHVQAYTHLEFVIEFIKLIFRARDLAWVEKEGTYKANIPARYEKQKNTLNDILLHRLKPNLINANTCYGFNVSLFALTIRFGNVYILDFITQCAVNPIQHIQYLSMHEGLFPILLYCLKHGSPFTFEPSQLSYVLKQLCALPETTHSLEFIDCLLAALCSKHDIRIMSLLQAILSEIYVTMPADDHSQTKEILQKFLDKIDEKILAKQSSSLYAKALHRAHEINVRNHFSQ